MSLNWSLPNATEIAKKYPPAGTQMNSTTYVIIMSTMLVGVGALRTDADITCYWERISFWEKVNGALLLKTTENGTEPAPLTRADIEAHRGLTANVARETDAAFIKKAWRAHVESLRREENRRA